MAILLLPTDSLVQRAYSRQSYKANLLCFDKVLTLGPVWSFIEAKIPRYTNIFLNNVMAI